MVLCRFFFWKHLLKVTYAHIKFQPVVILCYVEDIGLSIVLVADFSRVYVSNVRSHIGWNECQLGRWAFGWIVRSHISWGGEQNIIYKNVETSL